MLRNLGLCSSSLFGAKTVYVGKVLSLALLSGCFSSPGANREKEPILHGVALDGYPLSAERLSTIAHMLGQTPNLILFYLQWPRSESLSSRDDSLSTTLNAIASVGALPVLTWEPMYYDGERRVIIKAEEILEGKYDKYLEEVAEKISRFEKPLLLRFAHEMNLISYRWGEATELEFGQSSPASYVKMYRYVVDFMRRKKVENVSWIFCPNSESEPWPQLEKGTNWNRISNFYPGDDYVDILGIDGYDWGDTLFDQKSGWRSSPRQFRDIFLQPLQELRQLAPTKPLLVFETATVKTGKERLQWYRSAAEYAHTEGIDGIVWFHVDKEQKWALQEGFYEEIPTLIIPNKKLLKGSYESPLLKHFRKLAPLSSETRQVSISK